MAELPDPTRTLGPEDHAAFKHMAAARADADGRAALGDVYVRMFNNPGVAVAVGALGEHLRFHGVLPDTVRELVILRFSANQRLGYEWSHHQRPARVAGLDDSVISQLAAGEFPAALTEPECAALVAVDAVVAHRSIPSDAQRRLTDAYGTAGVVEVVALCGLYALMGYATTAFDIHTEPGLPAAPF